MLRLWTESGERSVRGEPLSGFTVCMKNLEEQAMRGVVYTRIVYIRIMWACIFTCVQTVRSGMLCAQEGEEGREIEVCGRASGARLKLLKPFCVPLVVFLERPRSERILGT